MKFEGLPSDTVWDIPFAIDGYWVYFLLDETGEVVYVGQTTRLFSRLRDHTKDDRKASIVASIKLVRCRDERQMDVTEQFYIDRYQPILNIAGTLVTDQPSHPRLIQPEPLLLEPVVLEGDTLVTNDGSEIEIYTDGDVPPKMGSTEGREHIRSWLATLAPGTVVSNADLTEVRKETGWGRTWGYKVMSEFTQKGIITRHPVEDEGCRWIVTDHFTGDSQEPKSDSRDDSQSDSQSVTDVLS